MPTMLNSLKRSIRYQEEGATAVEYGIMVALIAAVIVLVVLALGQQVCKGFDSTSEALKTGGITPTKDAAC